LNWVTVLKIVRAPPLLLPSITPMRWLFSTLIGSRASSTAITLAETA
jgi:hypothetical protein